MADAVIYDEGERYQMIWECSQPQDEWHKLKDTQENITLLSYLDVKPVPVKTLIALAERLNAYEHKLKGLA